MRTIAKGITYSRDNDLKKVEDHIKLRMTMGDVRKGQSVLEEYESTIALVTQRPDWFINLNHMVSKAATIIDGRVYKSTEEDGLCRLTATSISIARALLNYETEVSTRTLIRIGDIFIDAFLRHHLIQVVQPNITRRDPTWYVGWTPKGEIAKDTTLFAEEALLRDTDVVPPEPTTKLMREFAGRKSLVVKRTKRDTPLDFSVDHYRALDKVQTQGWVTNNLVLDKIIEMQGSFKSKNESKQLSYNTIIKKAIKARELGTFYQINDIDYRGRFYTMEPFFSYQGQDIARGMFLFAEGQVMTEEGWYWLFVHTANSFNVSFKKDAIPDWCEQDYKAHLEKHKLDTISLDKMALCDRVSWVQENLEEILRLGREVEFWCREDGQFAAEKPTSFLAACVEIARLTDDYEALTHLPIAVDGSNNGWQHLIAMARDHDAAPLVGMTDEKIPEDFYLSTGKRMIEILSESEDDLDQTIYGIVDKMPMKDIRKGLSKRGSMTRAYSAGASAIAENMWADCKKEDFHVKYFGYEALAAESILNNKAEQFRQDYMEDEGAKVITIKEASELYAEQTCITYCKRIAKHLVAAILDVCKGPLYSMKFFMELAKYEVGTYKWYDESGVEATSKRNKIRLRRKELIMTDAPEKKGGKERRMTDEELDELNILSVEMNTYTQALSKGNGNSAISWTTPSGFQVNSGHFLTFIEGVAGNIKNVRIGADAERKNHIVHMYRVVSEKASLQDTVSAISPNVVHSYDASHLAICAANWDGAIGVIHDSYSTHASDVPRLLDLVKDVFIYMYEDKDTFEDLQSQILTNDDGFDFPKPEFGKLDFNEIAKSDFFFA